MNHQSSPSPPVGEASDVGSFENIKPDDELLVAYLDGELDSTSASQVEMKLASDAELRQRLNDLRVAWDLLEELPPVDPNPRFAQSTIEMVAMNAVSLSEEKTDRRKRWRFAAAVFVLLPVMFALGFVAVRASQRYAERQAIKELHILADWDALKEVESYEWLQQIRSIRDLGRVVKHVTTSNLGNGLVPATTSERRTWIHTLSGTSRDRLSANLVAFKRVSPEQRQKIADLARQIYQGPDPLGDLQAARDYAQFLSEMSISDRAEHRDEKDDAKRLDDLARRVNRKMVEVYTRDLTPDSPDRIAVKQWLEKMQDDYGSALPRGGVRSDLMRFVGGDLDSVIDDVDLDLLLASLTPEAKEIIGRIRSKNAQYQALIFYFVNDTYPFRGPSRRQVDRAQLTERFEALPDSRKSVIEFLPPDKAQDQLGMRSSSPGRDSTGPSRGLGSPLNPDSRNQQREERIEKTENQSLDQAN